MMCKSPHIEFKEFEQKQHEEYKEKILNNHDAKADNFSLIIFTYGYYDTKISVVNNNNTLFEGSVKSNESMGYAKTLRVDNEQDVILTDIQKDYHFTLKPKLTKKYKYIYIGRNENRRRMYTVTYSNTMRTFK